MANVKFELDCPKCDEPIVIRSSAQIGKKVACPKCKYSFTVPEMDDEDDDDAPASKKGGKKKKAGSGMLIIGVVLGLLALGGLAVGAIVVLGGSGDDKKQSSQSPTPAPNMGAGMMPPGGSGTAPPPVTPPENPGSEGKRPKKPRPAGLKEITNLLPGEATSVWHLRMDELARTPLYSSIFDTPTKALFLTSMTFDAADVDEILHCYTGPEKDVFAIIRTKAPLDTDEMTKRLNLESPKNNVVKGREFYLLKSNAFLTAISKSLSLGSVLGIEAKSAKARPAKPADERKLAFSVYDAQTIVLADQSVMERFLSDLKEDGLLPFKSELTLPPPPPADPTGPGGPMTMPPGPMGPMGPGKTGALAPPRAAGGSADAQAPKPGVVPMPMPGGMAPMPMPGGINPMPGAYMPPGGPMGPGGAAAPSARRSFTANPFFRTVEPDLKKALNTLEDDDRDTPGAVYVQRVEQRTLSDLDLRALGLPDLADGILVSWLQQVKVMGFSITAMDRTKGIATGYFDYVSEDDAKKSAAEHVLPVLTALQLLYTIQTKENLTIRDLTQGQGSGGQPGGPMYPGGPGGPMFPGGPGAAPPPGGLIRPGRGNPGGISQPSGTPDSRPGEDAQIPFPMGGSPSGPGPGGPPTGYGPMFPGGATGGTSTPAGSRIDVSLSDTVVSVQFELEWQESTYLSIVLPGVGRMTAQLKGRMSVLSGENDAFALAATLPKIVKDKGTFPMGALERDARTERYGLPYPPEQRVSLFAELLPYLGRAGLRSSIDKNNAWYDGTKKNASGGTNLAVAETWVPEFLVPYYDPSAWRATHELADGRSLGATNYVGLAGLGLDAARYNSRDPAVQKKLGMYGYDWTSKPDDVTDGLSNTIAMMQVPPGHQRPWIAGGGATLAGIDDRGDKPLQNYTVKMPDGTRGTTVLMGDGSVRTVRESIDPALLRAMVTRAGAEAIDDLETAAPKVKPAAKKKTELSTPVSSVKPPVPTAGIDADELKKLQGRWKPVRIFEDGKNRTGDQLPKNAAVLVIEGTTISLSIKSRREDDAVLTKLDPSTSPKQLDLKNAEKETVLAVYELDGDKKLKLKLDVGGKDKPRPTDLKDPEAGATGIRVTEFEKVD